MALTKPWSSIFAHHSNPKGERARPEEESRDTRFRVPELRGPSSTTGLLHLSSALGPCAGASNKVSDSVGALQKKPGPMPETSWLDCRSWTGCRPTLVKRIMLTAAGSRVRLSCNAS